MNTLRLAESAERLRSIQEKGPTEFAINFRKIPGARK